MCTFKRDPEHDKSIPNSFETHHIAFSLILIFHKGFDVSINLKGRMAPDR